MNQRPDKDVVSFIAIENQMRLETKLSKARQNLFSANAYSRKVSEQSKCALQARRERRNSATTLVSAATGLR